MTEYTTMEFTGKIDNNDIKQPYLGLENLCKSLGGMPLNKPEKSVMPNPKGPGFSDLYFRRNFLIDNAYVEIATNSLESESKAVLKFASDYEPEELIERFEEHYRRRNTSVVTEFH